jgi:multiple sugar transport system permease protein
MSAVSPAQAAAATAAREASAPPAPRRHNPGYGRFTPLWFLAPSIIALLLIGIYPTIFALVTSFRSYNITRRQDMLDGFPFVGLTNYAQALTDSTFWDSLALTGKFYLTVMPVEIALGLVIALMLHRPGMGFLRAFARVSLVVPLATTYTVVGLIGRLIFNRDFGVANQFLGWIGISSSDWLGNADGAFIAIVVMDVWQWTPFVALIFLAGLSMVPVEIEEAARLETKSQWALLRYVQLPYMLPGLTAILILRSADVLKLFDMVFVMTRGGPGSATDLVSIYVQRVGFKVFDLGVASAQAILLLILTIVLSRVYIRLLYREIE